MVDALNERSKKNKEVINNFKDPDRSTDESYFTTCKAKS